MWMEKSVCDSIRDYSLKIKQSVSAKAVAPVPTPVGIKFPKIGVLKFDGNMLNWQSFWESFNTAIYERLSNTEQLTYLRDALKDGLAKAVIEGLTQTGKCYDEAIASRSHGMTVHASCIKHMLGLLLKLLHSMMEVTVNYANSMT